MTIVCDVDGVLADFDHAFLALLNHVSGKQAPTPDGPWPAVWNWMPGLGFTSDEIRATWDYIRAKPVWWAEALVPLPHGQQILRVLRQLRRDHQVYFLTSRVPQAAQRHTQVWLERYGFELASVILQPNGRSKGDVLKALNADLFIDDKPENIRSALDADIARCWLADQPHNRRGSGLGRGALRMSAADIVLSLTALVAEEEAA